MVNSGWTVFTHHNGSVRGNGPKTIEATEEFKFGQRRLGGKKSLGQENLINFHDFLKLPSNK